MKHSIFQCRLCGTDGFAEFCCIGCKTVYQILEAKGSLKNFSENPLFLQAVRSGLISNPTLLDSLRGKREPEEIHSLFLEIEEMWCPSCAYVIRLVLEQKEGVHRCSVDYTTDLASIKYDPKKIGRKEIEGEIRSLGYKPHSIAEAQSQVSSRLFVRLAVAIFCALNLMMFSYPIYASYFVPDVLGYTNVLTQISFFVALPLLAYSAWPLFKRAIISLTYGILGMEFLVSMGVTAAFCLSSYEVFRGGDQIYFDSMGAIVVFVLLGKVIESRAKFDAKQSLFRMVRALPRRARKRFKDGREQFVPMKELSVGDEVVAFSGEKIVIEGVVSEGEATVDQSLLTGESVPIRKQVGDEIFGGSVLVQGHLAYRVTTAEEKSLLRQMLNSIEGALETKKGEKPLVDRVVSVFVPLVILLAFMTGIFGGEDSWLHAVSVLLIACPCAIGIATPIVESRLLHVVGEMGAIVRNRKCLSKLAKISCVVFDKTGTVTEGKFRVQEGLENLNNSQKAILKSLSVCSAHPVCFALSQSIDLPFEPMKKTIEYPGRGIEGGGYYLGSRKWMEEQKVTIPDDKESFATEVFFVQGKRCLSKLVLGDRVKVGVKELLLKLFGQRKILLSGDNLGAVSDVARQLGFDEFQAENDPLEKKEFISALREKEVVMMVGDGINDAPALSAADVGVSVASATDITVQVSDLLLTHDRLEILPHLMSLAKKGQRIIKQNLCWAFAYNVVGIGFAIFGILTPLHAAFAMVLSSTMVVCNARRLTTPRSLSQTDLRTSPQTLSQNLVQVSGE